MNEVSGWQPSMTIIILLAVLPLWFAVSFIGGAVLMLSAPEPAPAEMPAVNDDDLRAEIDRLAERQATAEMAIISMYDVIDRLLLDDELPDIIQPDPADQI